MIFRSASMRRVAALAIVAFLFISLLQFYKYSTRLGRYKPTPEFLKQLSLARQHDRESTRHVTTPKLAQQKYTAGTTKTNRPITVQQPGMQPIIDHRPSAQPSLPQHAENQPIPAQIADNQPIVTPKSVNRPIIGLVKQREDNLPRRVGDAGQQNPAPVNGQPTHTQPKRSAARTGNVLDGTNLGDSCIRGRNKAKEQEWAQRDLETSKQTTQTSKERAEHVKQMMTHAWSNYEKYAWGANELAPIVRNPHHGIFAGSRMGLTIVDSLDTLWIMGMFEEVERGKRWMMENLQKATNQNAEVSVFEFNIRFVGGLLSMYALTNECEYKQLAKMCADKLVPAFNTTHGVPVGSVNLRHSFPDSYKLHGTAVLSELGTLHLEFVYLSHITGISKYRALVENLRDVLAKASVNGLYGNTFHIDTSSFGSEVVVSLGGMGDSFYEYLFKSFLQTDKRDIRAKKMYFDAMEAIYKAGVLKTSSSGLKYFGIKYGSGDVQERMEHLACFIGGLMGLSAEHSANKTWTLYMGEEVARTCHESYIRAASRIGPESFNFMYGREAQSVGGDKSYHMRPEVIESWYFLQRVTDKQMYREWAWDFIQALEKYCRVPNGYAGLRDVYLQHIDSKGRPLLEDQQQSFFLAETLKYLYLIYKDDGLLPLNDWVFNTEAHPLPVLRGSGAT